MQVTPNTLLYDLAAGEFESQSFLFPILEKREPFLILAQLYLVLIPIQTLKGALMKVATFWTTSNDETNMPYEWIDIENIGTFLTFQNNDSFASEEIQLPFSFPYFNDEYTSLAVNANGWVGWDSENETVWQNGSIPSSSMPRPAIFGFFDDLNPETTNGTASASGNILYHVDFDRAVIWFDDVVRWTGEAGSGTYDFQIVLYSDGRFKCNYRQMDGAIDQATIGWQNSLGTEGTELVSLGDSFVSDNFSWEAKIFSDDIVPWISLF